MLKQLLFLLNFFIVFNAFSQEIVTVRDFGTWTGVTVEKKVAKSIKTALNGEIRLDYNSTRVSSMILESDWGYKVNDFISFNYQLRYIRNRKKDDSFYHDLRNAYNVKIEKRVSKKYELSYRFRYQKVYGNLFTLNMRTYDPSENKAQVRNRIAIERRMKSYRLFLSNEIFREYRLYRKPVFNSYRAVLGAKFKVNSNKVSVGFAYERSWHLAEPFNFFFTKLNYEFEL